MGNLAAVLAIVFVSTLVQSTFSFGAALVALPLLVLVIDIKTATLLMTLLSCSIAIVVTAKRWRDIKMGNAWRLVVAACLGIPLGILYLARLDGRQLKIGLAITVILFTLINLLSFKNVAIRNTNWAFAFGAVSGVFGGAYNMSGPPVVLYGTLSGWDSEQFRATIQVYSLFTNLFAVAGHALAGHFSREAMLYYGWSLPIMGITIWLGSIVHKAIPNEKYVIIVKLLLLVLGARLLVSSL